MRAWLKRKAKLTVAKVLYRATALAEDLGMEETADAILDVAVDWEPRQMTAWTDPETGRVVIRIEE